ncbi:hypothetical protein [Georgenia subflava]|uniref:Uncharacterized protein n=1 Tax=Georgenia subflava TaxID=1622177 RepID=A0A6N7EET1_9MICO|nr:hypothetical protein [Georgenia subflava]MPV35468.1 hypothetical protein [Georgenia subflava]
MGCPGAGEAPTGTGPRPGTTRPCRRPGQARAARRRLVVHLLGSLALLAGCANPGGLDGHLSQAAAQAASAAASASLGLDLYLKGRTSATVADITFVDMAREASTAEDAATQQVVANPDELARRDDVAEAIATAAETIGRARALVSGAVPRDEGDGLVDDLLAQADALATTADHLEEAAG